jgi:hypothetical protein
MLKIGFIPDLSVSNQNLEQKMTCCCHLEPEKEWRNAPLIPLMAITVMLYVTVIAKIH